MGMGGRRYQINLCLMVCSRKVVRTEVDKSNSTMDHHIEVNSRTTFSTARVSSGGQTGKFIEVAGKKTKCADKENSVGQMGGNMRDILWMI